MITKVKPDKQKSESLRKMAKITLERLGKTDMEKYPSNTLSDYYDVIHKLIEAITIFNTHRALLCSLTDGKTKF